MIEGLKPYAEYKDSRLNWLGKLPATWELRRAKFLFREVDERSKTGKEELLSVSHKTGVTPRSQKNITMFMAESNVGHKICRPQDLVINTLWAWMAAMGVSNQTGIVSPAYGVYRPIDTGVLLPRFSDQLLRTPFYADEYKRRSTGVNSSRLRLYPESFLGIPVVLPPLEEQASIVRFLDHANRKIDGFIRAKRKLIGLLNEQKQAIIHRAVTRGLDPDVTLKPSGIPWLGDIPTHWEAVRSRRLFTVRTDLARTDDVQLSATQSYGVIPQADYEAKIGRRVVKISMHLEKRKHVEKDDFVISMRSFQGGIERAWASGAIRSSYVVMKPDTCVDVSFFSYVLKSPGYIRALQATGDFIRDGQDLTYSNFRMVDLPLMPMPEQKEIAAYIETATKALETSIARTDREIALMQEYRTRLTADIVTGKLDVRDAAAKLPDTKETGPTDKEVSMDDDDEEVNESN
ncbi:MAG: restriction endonuclease subunit S [Pirellula sp.]|nr:restriction endonuclease subunit S [Pirellula sp.]